MTPDKLLKELEALTHAMRMRRMMELGRTSSDSNIEETIAALERGNVYARYFALQSCAGSRDGEHVLRSLSDTSHTIRGLAIQLAPVVCNDDQLQRALETSPLPQRNVLLRKLRKRRRYVPIDLFLETLATRHDEYLGLFLPFGSSALVARYRAQLLSRPDTRTWRRLAHLHPDIALDALEQEASLAEQLDQRLVWQANGVLPIVAHGRPDQTLSLVRALLRTIPLAQLELQPLVERRPSEVAGLLLQSDDRAHLHFDHVAHRLPIEQLQALAEQHSGAISNRYTWFKRLTPAQRSSLYTAQAVGWRDAEGSLNHFDVALLPRLLREQEGRRHLALPALIARPAQRLPWAAFLPWDEAYSILEPFIRNPDAVLRAAALSTLAFATRYHRNQLSQLLTMVRNRRNEQDPVRYAMLEGLADLPPSMWREEHLADLGQIIRETLDAADLSTMTASAVERLVVALLPFHPVWGARSLATLVQERGYVSIPYLDQRLSDDHTRQLAPVLLPVLQAWETREREGQLVSVASSFGRRLRVFNGLAELLERVIVDTRSAWTATNALNILASHRRDRLATLVPTLVRKDQSFITLQPVYTYLHHRRQDLITPFLGQQAYRGRFSSGKTRFVLPLYDGFHRWTPTQQAIFARTLDQLTRDEERDSPAVLGAINQLAALPAVDHTRLIQLADLHNPRPMSRDAALRALGRLDAGQGVPTLLAAMADDRARIAIYVLRRALLAMPEERALHLLRAMPMTGVTVAKEVVRLVGELRGEEAYRYLLDLDGTSLHRDVRVALLRALWEHLERPATWSILERAATASDPAIAAAVVRIPAEGTSQEAQRRLVALLAMLLTHTDAKLRVDVLQRCASLPVRDTDRLLVPPLLAAMDSSLPDEQEAAASAIFATYVGRDAPLVAHMIARLLPNRRALQTALHALQARLPWSRSQLLPTVRATLTSLANDPLLSSFRVEIGTLALPWSELATLFQQMAESNELHSEALMRAVQAIHHASARPDVTELLSLEMMLAASKDGGLRRLALAALTAQAQAPRGWDAERLVRLRAYRDDPALLVAAAAQFTFPPDEEL